METKQKAKGSWGVRFFIVVLGITLGLLFFWLLSFVEQDIGSVKKPDWEKIRREYVSEQMDDNQKHLRKDVESLNRQINALKEQQRTLGSTISSLRTTMNQLLAIHQQYIDKGEEVPAESRQTLGEKEAAFLESQQKDLEYTERISVLIEQRQQKDDGLTTASEQIKSLEEDASEDQKERNKKFKFRVAVMKLSFLVPVFLAVSFLFMKYRTSAYWPLVWAAFISAFIKVGVVAHKYFPEEYFKYIAWVVITAIVLRILIYLIRLVVAPKKDLLIKQYQQFYDKHLCPVCTKPIKAGPLRYAAWKKKATVLTQAADIEQQPYTCPSCGTNLYDKCGTCGKIRHALLPYCEHCGTEKTE
jgi:predicted RNA-binding Zn-ribbon protein involved in translation (DUF1610 family)/Na+-transporting methylmalonyl-CoA/oxaloacetate decarboxylase gamma subunit